MKRVVVTGIGIVSSLGNNKEEVLASLQQAKSGISFQEEYKTMGFRSHIAGAVRNLDLAAQIDRKILRFMGDSAAYAYLSMREAIIDSGLTEEQWINISPNSQAAYVTNWWKKIPKRFSIDIVGQKFELEYNKEDELK